LILKRVLPEFNINSQTIWWKDPYNLIRPLHIFAGMIDGGLRF